MQCHFVLCVPQSERDRGRERGRGRGRERYAANDILEAGEAWGVGRGLTRDTQCTDNEINMFVLC